MREVASTGTETADRFVNQLRPLSADNLPWLYFGITRPVGTPVTEIVGKLTSDLNDAGYDVQEIKLSELIEEAYSRIYDDATPNPVRASRGAVRTYEDYIQLMRKGDLLRQSQSNDIVGRLAISSIRNRRQTDLDQLAFKNGRRGVAYVISSFLHPQEIDIFRSAYGRRFFLIGISAPRLDRLRGLERHFKSTRDRQPMKSAKALTQIDGGLKAAVKTIPKSSRLNVDNTFHLADVLCTVDVNLEEPGKPASSERNTTAIDTVDRFTAQLFGFPFGTVTKHEWSMSVAYSTAKSSASLGRSVGAALVDRNGSLIGTGCNEVARPGGGPYRPTDRPDLRDHRVGHDVSDVLRFEAIRDFLDLLFRPGDWIDELEDSVGDGGESSKWLATFKAGVDTIGRPPEELVRLLPILEDFSDLRVLNLIEFGRSVHAEMAAITEAARRGAAVQDSSVYITTFPCHECTRNMINAAVETIYFVEPYGKSLSAKLYAREIRVFGELNIGDSESVADRLVNLEPYVGISPRALDVLFDPVARKYGVKEVPSPSLLDEDDDVSVGKAVEWSRKASSRLRPAVLGYRLTKRLSEAGAMMDPEIELARLAVEEVIADRTEFEIDRLRPPDAAS